MFQGLLVTVAAVAYAFKYATAAAVATTVTGAAAIGATAVGAARLAASLPLSRAEIEWAEQDRRARAAASPNRLPAAVPHRPCGACGKAIVDRQPSAKYCCEKCKRDAARRRSAKGKFPQPTRRAV